MEITDFKFQVHLDEIVRNTIAKGKELTAATLAAEVLRHTVGKDWWSKATKRDRANFLLPKNEPERTRNQKLTQRFVSLGSMLWELRTSIGFSEMVSRLSKADAKSTYYELFSMRLLKRSGFEIKYSTEKKIKHFDFRALRRDLGFNCEVKSKHSKSLNAETLINSLKKTRGQFKPDEPSIVFLAIGDLWPESNQVEAQIVRSIESFLRSKSRINYVILIGDLYKQLGPNQWAHMNPYIPIKNLFAKIDFGNVKLIEEINFENTFPYFEDLLGSNLIKLR